MSAGDYSSVNLHFDILTFQIDGYNLVNFTSVRLVFICFAMIVANLTREG